MFNRKELKERAKQVLLRSYSKVFLACLVVNLLSGGGLGLSMQKLKNVDFSAMPQQKAMAVFVILIVLSIITAVISVFVLSPLLVGLKKFMLENAKGDTKLDVMLSPFNEGYKNIVIVQFVKGLFIFLWSLPTIIPTVILGIYIEKLMILADKVIDGSGFAALTFLGIMLLWLLCTLLLAIPSIIKELQYAMVPYILADSPETKWKSALLQSKEMMFGNKWAYVKLILSFFLWYLAASLIYLIGGFLLAPYIEATVCEMYLEISGKAKISVE